jgi:hypothetical protein
VVRRLAPALGLAAALLFGAAATGCSGSDSTTAPSTTTTAPPETTTSTSEAPLEAGKQLFVYAPAVGDCFDRRTLTEKSASGQSEIVLKLDCALPHENEVFDVVDFPDPPKDYPGEETLRSFARRACVRNFASYVGAPYETSALEIGYVIPTEPDWGSRRTRIGCTLVDASGKRLVGSMRGSAR